MVKKTSLAKKLASYSAVAAAVLVADKNADAQIVYTNLNPGDTIGRYNSHDVKLDLNNDGIYDFDFNYNSFSRVTSYVGRFEHVYQINCGNAQPYYSNAVYGSTFRIFLNYGDTISYKLKPWYGENLAEIECFSNRCYPGIDTSFNTYIGLKISKKGRNYYGWARLQVGYSSNENVFAIVKDYAYNNIPDSAIYAGVECTPNFTQPSLQIKNNTASTNAVNTIQWCVNNKPIAGDTTQSITLSQYGLYRVKEGDTTQCYTESTTYNYIDCNTYKPNIGSAIQVICGDDYNNNLKIDTIPNDFSVKWFHDDTLLYGDSNQVLYYVNTIGNYFAVIYEQEGCYDTTNRVNVKLDSVGYFLVVRQDGDTLFADSSNSRFSAGVTYQWYNLSGTIQGAISYYYIIPQNGYYGPTISDSLCNYGSELLFYNLSGITQINPANIFITESNNLLTIKFNDEPYNDYKLIIYNYIGQQVYNSEVTSADMEFNLSSLTKGLYLVTLEKEGGRVVKKIVVQ